MSKRFTIAVAALSLSCASSAALAALPGQFFINGSAGQSNYHDSGFNTGHTDTALAGRFGYAWNNGPVSYGVEAGYVDLGKATGSVYTGSGYTNFSGKASGPLLGVNMTYHFRNHMFLNGRLGWFHDKFDTTIEGVGSQSFSGNGGYIGVGAGYDFNEHFGVGLAYDHYNVRAKIYGTKSQDSVGVFSGFVEVRF